MGISLEVPSGTEFAAYVEQSVLKGGGTYVNTLYVAPGATEVTAQMVELQEGIDEQGVNYVTLHGSPGAGLVVMQGMADVGITDIPIIGIHGIAANSIWTEGPESVSDQTFGIHSFMTANNNIAASADMERCATLAGYDGEHLNLNFSHGFLNGYVFHQAVERAAETGELSRESLTEALKGLLRHHGHHLPDRLERQQPQPVRRGVLARYRLRRHGAGQSVQLLRRQLRRRVRHRDRLARIV